MCVCGTWERGVGASYGGLSVGGTLTNSTVWALSIGTSVVLLVVPFVLAVAAGTSLARKSC